MTATANGVKFSDADVVNPDDWEFGKYKPWLIHEAGFVLAVVFAETYGDALDEAADAGRLDKFRIDPKDKGDLEDYFEKDVIPPGYDPNCPEYTDEQGNMYWPRVGWEPHYLGNASEPFDTKGVEFVELKRPPFSFVALYNAAEEK